MGDNEAKKTMRFWIFSGIAAIVASQLPLFIKKRKQPDSNQSQQQQQRKKRPLWIKLLIGAVIGLMIRMIFWLYDFFT
jgi:drug/metabolite transporter (DMT)-like permease